MKDKRINSEILFIKGNRVPGYNFEDMKINKKENNKKIDLRNKNKD
jgi:hypothetical protein